MKVGQKCGVFIQRERSNHQCTTAFALFTSDILSTENPIACIGTIKFSSYFTERVISTFTDLTKTSVVLRYEAVYVSRMSDNSARNAIIMQPDPAVEYSKRWSRDITWSCFRSKSMKLERWSRQQTLNLINWTSRSFISNDRINDQVNWCFGSM